MTAGSQRITAVLGPTNTGKTYFAVERMLGHRTGMIGFPLRLLARENYDRIVKLKGASAVALITGEEKIIPAHPSYFVCTVESMPLDRRVDFLAVDEIQLAADPERGHVFTDRLLHARGVDETMFLGADTIRPLLRKLVPEAEFIRRPRFSTLTYTGPKKITRLPRRSAVVAFSAADVYALAELMRRQRGGSAVVMGALSPAHAQRPGRDVPVRRGRLPGRHRRHRHGPQHGSRPCRLRRAGQVRRPRLAPPDGAGDRADRRPRRPPHERRHLRHHRPKSVRSIPSWSRRSRITASIRWHALSGATPISISARLARPAAQPRAAAAGARPDPRARGRRSSALAALARDPELADLARSRDRAAAAVGGLPDPRFPQDADRRATRGFSRRSIRHLATEPCVLPTDWVAGADAAHRPHRGRHRSRWCSASPISAPGPTSPIAATGWPMPSIGRSARARSRTACPTRCISRSPSASSTAAMPCCRTGWRRRRDFISAVSADGDVVVEGHAVGRLDGLHFVPERAANSEAQKSLMTSARRALAQELPDRLRRLETRR